MLVARTSSASQALKSYILSNLTVRLILRYGHGNAFTVFRKSHNLSGGAESCVPEKMNLEAGKEGGREGVFLFLFLFLVSTKRKRKRNAELE